MKDCIVVCIKLHFVESSCFNGCRYVRHEHFYHFIVLRLIDNLTEFRICNFISAKRTTRLNK